MSKLDEISLKSIFTSLKLSIETLMGEIKPVVPEKNQIEFRNKWVSIALLVFLDYRGLDGRININDLMAYSERRLKFLIQDLMEEIRAVVTEENEFEKREESKF